MTPDNNLIPITMKEQCNSALQILEQDNRNLEEIQNQFRQFIQNEELVSEAFCAIKQQISDYLTLSSLMICANDLDIEDLHILKDAVGEQELRGDAIQNYKDNARSDMGSFMNKAAEYAGKAAGVPEMTPLHGWYGELAAYYELRGIFAERKYGQYLEMEQRYDDIEAATRHLFTRSAPLRNVVRQGLESVCLAFRDGTYHIDQSASWRISLVREKEQLLEEIKAGFLRTSAGGGQEYDWDRIGAWLEKEAGTVPELEYLAFADLMSEMDDNELETLFSKAQIMDRPGERVYCQVSEVMKEAAGRYLMLTELEAELTLFDPHSSYQYDEIMVTNELSRAVFIHQTVTVMDMGRYNSVRISVTTGDSGKQTYRADITVKAEVNMNPNDSEAWGRVLASEMEKKTVVVNPWGPPLTAGEYLDDNVKTTLLTLEGSLEETLAKAGVTNAAEYIFAKIGEGTTETIGTGLTSSFTLLELTKDMKEDYENVIAMEGAINSIDARRAIVAMGINTGMVTVTGPNRNSLEFVCPKYNPEELLIRVEVYNQKNETSITVDELKESFEQDGQIFADYMKWYYEDGNGAVDEYWDGLEKVMIDFYGEYPETDKKTTRSMTTEQLQELINKYNNPSYEINAEIMKGKK